MVKNTHLFLSGRIVSKQTTPIFLLFLYRFAMLLETLWNQNYSVYWVLFIMLILKPLMWYSNILLKLTKFEVFLFQKAKECTDGQKQNKKIGRWDQEMTHQRDSFWNARWMSLDGHLYSFRKSSTLITTFCWWEDERWKRNRKINLIKTRFGGLGEQRMLNLKEETFLCL